MKKFYILIPALAIAAVAAADTWRPMGNAIVTDGWITPAYVDNDGKQLNPAEYPFEVPVEESVENPGIYRLINPFCTKDFHLSEYNLDTDGDDHNLIIDARDRTFVTITPQYCGFTDADSEEPDGRYSYYLTDMGTYMWSLGQSREVINALKFSSIMSANTIYVRVPAFNKNGEGIQSWDSDVVYPSTITLPDNFADEADQWSSLGRGNMIEGWLMPGWTDELGRHLKPADYPFEVEVMQNIENPDLYCIADPFHEPDYVLAPQNLTASRVRIVLDASDPDFVRIEPQYAGFAARLDNDISAYFITDAGTWMLANGRTEQQVIDAGYNATFVDGVFTIPQPLFGFDIESPGKIWNNPHPTILTLYGAGGVESTSIDADAPVEYYNLQGIRVNNPEPGRLYVRRQGTSTAKILYR